MKTRFIFRGLLLLPFGLATVSAQNDSQSSNETTSNAARFFRWPATQNRESVFPIGPARQTSSQPSRSHDAGSSIAPSARKTVSLTLESFGYKSTTVSNEDGLVQPTHCRTSICTAWSVPYAWRQASELASRFLLSERPENLRYSMIGSSSSAASAGWRP